MSNPEQKVNIVINPYETCFSFKRYKEPIKINDINKKYYNKIIPYNKDNSKSAKKGSVTFLNFNSEFNDLYDMEEIFYLYKYSDIKNKSNSIINSTTFLRFLYGNNKTEEKIVYGEIGLNMNNYEDSSCPRFIYSLRIKNILEKYIWFFDFNSRFKGNFYIGPEPHYYNNENNLYKYYQYIKINTILSKEGYNKWNILFNKICFKNFSNNYMFNLNDKMATIDFNSGLVVGTFEFQKIIEEIFFNNLINKGICMKTLVDYFYKEQKIKYYVYKCNKNLKKLLFSNNI